MFKEPVIEKIDVDEGTLIICRKYLALQTPDGILQPADMDEYGKYLPVWHLIRLLSGNADLSGTITEETQDVLRQAFLGAHSKLSYMLHCNREDAVRNEHFLNSIDPKTEDDYVRVFSLIYGDLETGAVNWPFVCREELHEYLCQFMNEDYAYRLSKSVRMGKLYGGIDYDPLMKQEYLSFQAGLELLPEDIVNIFSKIRFLPEKALMRYIVHYAILAANSLIKNNNDVILELC